MLNTISDTKVCPFCAEEIKAEAIVCKHCSRALGPANQRTLNSMFSIPGIISRGNRSLFFVLCPLIACGLMVASYLSPYWTLDKIRQAAQNQDMQALSSLVDYESLRESFKAQMLSSMRDSLNKDPQLKNNPYAKVGFALGAMFANTAVDTFVSPAGIAALFNGAQKSDDISTNKQSNSGEASAGSFQNTSMPPPSAVDMKAYYENINTFAASLSLPSANLRPVFLLNRTGIFSWKLAAIKFTGNSIVSP